MNIITLANRVIRRYKAWDGNPPTLQMNRLLLWPLVITSLAGLAPCAFGQVGILTQPANQHTVLNGAATFTVTAIGVPPLRYQWRSNGQTIVDATNANNTLVNVLPTEELLDVIVANNLGSVTSAVAQVIVDFAPALAVQPQSQIISPAQMVTLWVMAVGSPNLGYRWRLGGVPLTNNANGSNYTILSAQAVNSGNYDVVVTNGFGGVTSQVATLTLRDPLQPQIIVPTTVVVPCAGPEGAIVSFRVVVSDPYDARPILTVTPPSGSVFPIGATTVVCTAVDYLGNAFTNTLTVEVTGACDTGFLAIQCPDNLYLDSKGKPTARANYSVTASNSVTGNPVTVVCTPPSGSYFAQGTNRVFCATVSGGGKTTCSFQVVVTNSAPPVILAPKSILVTQSATNGTGVLGAYVNFKVQLGPDSDPQTTLGVQPPAGSFFPLGSNMVAALARSPSGLTTLVHFPVVITPRAAPGETMDNWSFENPDGFATWHPSGSAFANGPVAGDLFTVKRIPPLQAQMQGNIGGDYWKDIVYPAGQQGDHWVCTADVPYFGFIGNLDDQFDETLTGTLLSKGFTIATTYITFLVGGNADNANLLVQLLVESPNGNIPFAGKTYAIATSTTGNDQEPMHRAWWNVPTFKGKAARIRIVDNSKTGHLNVDDFRFQDIAPTVETVVVGTTNYPAVIQQGGYYYDWDAPVWGFADMHTHPMSHLGFGAKLIHGSPDGGANDPTNPALALGNCDPDHGGFGLNNPTGDYFRQLLMSQTDDGGLDPHQQGWDATAMKQFSKWPVFTSLSHQQMWYEWMKRTFDGGQRVLVALSVNNQFLATAAKGDPNSPRDDRAVTDLQFAEFKAFSARHADFMEIAFDPFQLRSIVRSGKLAVILGVEVDDPGNLVEDPGVKGEGNNGQPDAFSKQRVTDEIEHLYQIGARYMFTIHLADNKFGGTPVSEDLLNIGSKFLNGHAETVQLASPADQITFHLTDLTAAFKDAQSQLPDLLKSLVFNGIQTIALAPILGGPIQGLAGSLAPDAAGVAGGIAGPFLPIIAAPLLLAFAGPDAAMTFLLHDLAGVSSADTARLVNAKLLPLPGNYPPYPDATQAPNGVRNALGLSDLGKFAVQVMMSKGMILDVDHMSQNSLNDTLNIATNLPGGYP